MFGVTTRSAGVKWNLGASVRRSKVTMHYVFDSSYSLFAMNYFSARFVFKSWLVTYPTLCRFFLTFFFIFKFLLLQTRTAVLWCFQTCWRRPIHRYLFVPSLRNQKMLSLSSLAPFTLSSTPGWAVQRRPILAWRVLDVMSINFIPQLCQNAAATSVPLRYVFYTTCRKNHFRIRCRCMVITSPYILLPVKLP